MRQNLVMAAFENDQTVGERAKNREHYKNLAKRVIVLQEKKKKKKAIFA